LFPLFAAVVERAEITLKITSKIIRGITGDLIVSYASGKTSNVIIRKGSTLNDIADLGNIESELDIHFALIDDVANAARLITAAFKKAQSGDRVIVLCPDNKARKAAIAVLGLKTGWSTRMFRRLVPARIVWTRFCNSGGLFQGGCLTGFMG
jgi:hypothetical protein